MTPDVWAVRDAYGGYVGRWSRLVAAQFLDWPRVPAGRTWLDVGCGTGALTATVLADAAPVQVVGVDPFEAFLTTARAQVTDPRATFRVGDARSLPLPDDHFDAVVSALALNFVPDPALAVGEFARVAARGAVVAAYVGDYADGMTMMRIFWDAAAVIDPAGAEHDEGARFPMCRPDVLAAL